MFRGRQANPCSNKFLYQKDIEHRQKMHKARMNRMKPAIDNKPPKKPSHLTNNKKREQMMEDRFVRIERENRLLLEKMSHIMSKKTLDNENDSFKYVRSLNKSYRKRELQRITVENQEILRRIQQREPFYNHAQWEEDRKAHEQYMRNICEYPVRQPDQEKKRGRKGKGKALKSSRSGMIPSLDAEYKRESQERLAEQMGRSASFSTFDTFGNNHAEQYGIGA
mmetsp:Transcript_15910/g.40213  ORF Transcript_15910/g.40213 Transcript_15910/m.40213 type:complete len:223 (+) Transcript_15910:207-875(+)